MDIEQSVASVIRYIQEHLEDAKLYLWEVPENYAVPSVYIQPPRSTVKRATFDTYKTTYKLYAWFMASSEWDAYFMASRIRDSLIMDNCAIYLMAKDGNTDLKKMKARPVEAKKIDSMTWQLEIEFTAYISEESDVPEKAVTKYILSDTSVNGNTMPDTIIIAKEE